MSTQPPRKDKTPNQALVTGLIVFLLLCVILSGILAAIEYQTSWKPISAVVDVIKGQEPIETPFVQVAVATRVPTFTPTPEGMAPPPAIPAPISPTDTPTPLPSPTPTSTPQPTATFTPTPTPTETSTPTSTATPDIQGTAQALKQATAAAQATARVRATATARAKSVSQKPKTTPKPSAPRPTGRVAFPVFDARRGMYDIYIANLDGTGLQMLISEASQPSWRKDGQLLAYRSWKSDERGLAILSFGGEPFGRFSTFLEDALPVWSPDSGDIVFFSRREGDRKPRIYRYSIHGRNEVVLKDGANVVFGERPSWMPDGRIVYRGVYPQTGIAVMAGFGGGSKLLLADDTATAPSASPNGRYITFMSRRDGNWEIYRMKNDGTGLRRLTKHAGNDGLPVWSSDSRHILFVSDRGGSWGMYIMNADGSGQRRLFTLPGPIDGRVAREPEFVSRGWIEESISWIP